MNDLLAYMAGFIDGEGSICIKSESKKRPFVIYLEVCNTNYQSIELFETTFGGKVRKRNWSKNQKNKAKNWKACYEWSLSKLKAIAVIKSLFPFLRIKKKQAMLVLRLAKIKRKYSGLFLRWNSEYKDQVLRISERIKLKCKLLNKRGIK